MLYLSSLLLQLCRSWVGSSEEPEKVTHTPPSHSATYITDLDWRPPEVSILWLESKIKRCYIKLLCSVELKAEKRCEFRAVISYVLLDSLALERQGHQKLDEFIHCSKPEMEQSIKYFIFYLHSYVKCDGVTHATHWDVCVSWKEPECKFMDHLGGMKRIKCLIWTSILSPGLRTTIQSCCPTPQ